MNFLRAVAVIAGKDLRVEMRQRESLTLMLFFACVIVLIFYFALDLAEVRFETVGSGVIWVSIHFTGALALSHSFRQEREQDSLRGLRLAPVDAGSIYLGKFLANSAILFLLEAILVPMIGFALNVPLAAAAGPLAVLLVLHTVGFSALGTLFAAISAQTRRGETLFPLLVFPVEIPLIVSAVRSTTAILGGNTLGDVARWVQLAIAFDLVILAAAMILFDHVLEES